MSAVKISILSENFKKIHNFFQCCAYICNQHETYIKMSKAKSIFGPVVLEITSWVFINKTSSIKTGMSLSYKVKTTILFMMERFKYKCRAEFVSQSQIGTCITRHITLCCANVNMVIVFVSILCAME